MDSLLFMIVAILFVLLLSIVGCLVLASVCFAQDSLMGTWKLNESKSKLGGGTKNTTVVYEPGEEMEE